MAPELRPAAHPAAASAAPSTDPEGEKHPKAQGTTQALSRADLDVKEQNGFSPSP